MGGTEQCDNQIFTEIERRLFSPICLQLTMASYKIVYFYGTVADEIGNQKTVNTFIFSTP